MLASRVDCRLACPSQAVLDGFFRAGVQPLSLASPSPVLIAHGYEGDDGLFEADVCGECWFAIEEVGADDIVFWNGQSGRFASWSGRAFALGEDAIGDATTYSFDCSLNVFADPMSWLRAKRDGIVVLPGKWPTAFDRLRDSPRIAVAEALLQTYRRWMKPSRLPALSVLMEAGRLAA